MADQQPAIDPDIREMCEALLADVGFRMDLVNLAVEVCDLCEAFIEDQARALRAHVPLSHQQEYALALVHGLIIGYGPPEPSEAKRADKIRRLLAVATLGAEHSSRGTSLRARRSMS